MNAQSLAYVDTVWSADTIEFCPHQPNQDIFTCGTYQLLNAETLEIMSAPGTTGQSESDSGSRGEPVVEKGEKEETREEYEEEEKEEEKEKKSPATIRVGKLYLFRADGDGKTVTELQSVEMPAILDSKWSPASSSTPELAVADAKSGLSIFNLRSKSGHTYLTLNQHLNVTETPGTLVLSLDYEPIRRRVGSASPSGRIITSLSNGELAMLRRKDTGEIEVEQKWKAHDFEPWVTAWDPWTEETVWSGGDDCKLKRWDLRMTSMPTFTYRKFEGGVTTITPSPHQEHLLAVGSYDSRLRIFDTRNPTSPLLEHEMPGSLWRTRFHPSPTRPNDILAACMYGGFHVVRLPESLVEGDDVDKKFDKEQVQVRKEKKEAMIVVSFNDHKSIAYGVDWSRLSPMEDETSLVASCSFYDHALHLWSA